MKSYHACFECDASLAGKRGTRGPRKFCDKSCAQSFRNRKRAVRSARRPLPVRGARWIPLTVGMFALVDSADFADVSHWNWCAQRGGKGYGWYAARGRTIAERKEKHAPILLHRYLLGEPAEHIDHKNGNGLDNRRANLRIATASQNIANSRSRKGSSKFKGVSYSKNKWCVTIRYNYKTIHLGTFDTERAAASAYDVRARQLFGEFARVNFPRKSESSALHD